MAANVETMFSVREKPWHGLGAIVMEAPTSADALRLAGLDWDVVQEPIYTAFKEPIEGYKANVRDCDRRILGVVSDRYKVVQNTDAFSFTDGLLGKGVRYETAGSLQEGKKVWLLARLPREYIIAGERISPSGIQQYTWRLRLRKGCHYPDKGGVQQYLESGVEHSEKKFQHRPYGQHSGQDAGGKGYAVHGGGIHGLP